MACNSFKLVFLFILFSFFNFPTTEALFRPTYCSPDNTTANSTYQVNLKTLFSSLSSKANTSIFYNDTVTDNDPSNVVYGLFMCRGDVSSEICEKCVLNLTQTLSSDCYLAKSAVMWHDECMVRYSNSYFFSTLETGIFRGYLANAANFSNQEIFMPKLNKTLNETADEAAFSPFGDRYATIETKVPEFQATIYCLAQCTRDLSPQDCRTCLADMIGGVLYYCGGRQGGRFYTPSCNIRYELYNFYNGQGPGALVPATRSSVTDSKYSQDPVYLSHNCSSEGITHDNLQQALRTLLYDLSSKATTFGYNGSYKIDVDNKIFGLFMCRGDIPPRLCGQCVLNATDRIASECRLSAEAIVWYSHCLLRYSNKNFFSKMSTSPIFSMLNVTDASEYESTFKLLVSKAFDKVVNKTRDSNEKYSTNSFVLNDYQMVYTLTQCTRDLSSRDCGSCLYDLIGSTPWSRLGSIGGRVLYPSCTMRFELFQFYRTGTEDQPPSPSYTEKKGESKTIILIVVPIVVAVILFSCCCYLLWRKVRKGSKTILKENFGHESTTVESLQFDLAIIEVATKNFSHENRIGKGGFGEVYKGVLLDGRLIAVKRLSISSRQGATEFKNEVLLIAKLQHRNLVAFIGFCLEEEEKILIYEYVPNKSLDYFLFDARPEKLLSWFERHKIIGEIALGILYLYEYSRLKVIHRDLKPSNILLDENMNPKISDFGLARIVEIDRQQESTNRIVGTLGYMSPEYAMRGQFSEKLDVFSFGVMVLEIITGKKNVGSYDSRHIADGLLSSAWRQYTNQTPLCILDQKIKENCSKFEVIRCIQIGLLCVQEKPDDRPTMTTIVSYLSDHLIELPSPREPAFFLHDKMDTKIVAGESSSNSVNEMSISGFLAR